MNTKNGCVLASWNCRMGLLDKSNRPTTKLEDIQVFLEQNKVDVLALSEVELHGPHSRVYRRNPVTEESLKQALALPGYVIMLPDTWRLANQARLILYIKATTSCKVVKQPQYTSSIPTITLEVRKGGRRLP